MTITERIQAILDEGGSHISIAHLITENIIKDIAERAFVDGVHSTGTEGIDDSDTWIAENIK